MQPFAKSSNKISRYHGQRKKTPMFIKGEILTVIRLGR